MHLSSRSGRHQCRDCGRHVERGLFEEYEPIRFRDASIGDFETYLQIHAMRIACCGGTRVERLPFAMPGFRMTRRFFERIAALCTKLPVWSVAKMGRLSWDTVARVDKRAIELALGDREHALEGLGWIGVKEQLGAILQYPWKYLGALRSRIREWIDAAIATDLAELARVARRLQPHIEAVVAGHKHHIKLGLVEPINSKIAALRVQARGYSDPEYFKLKIFQRCALPDNPWAQIVL